MRKGSAIRCSITTGQVNSLVTVSAGSWLVKRRFVGFVNVVWDGGAHAFLLDTVVALSHRGRDVGRALVQAAVAGASGSGGGWLHVDWARELDKFYLGACGFTPTPAGLYALR